MSAHQSTAFKRGKVNTHVVNFMVGIAIESGLVVMLMFIAYAISALGSWMF